MDRHHEDTSESWQGEAAFTRRGVLSSIFLVGSIYELITGSDRYGVGEWENETKAPQWGEVSGKHYDANDVAETATAESPLYSTIRDPKFSGSELFDKDVSSKPAAELPNDVTRIEGPFSGETRLFNFGSVSRDGTLASEVAKSLRLNRNGIFLVDALEDFETSSQRQKEYYQDMVYAAATYFSTGEFQDNPMRHWEVGNEVNGIAFFNPRGITLDSEENFWDYFNDREQARLYVNHYLGPVVEALRKAGEDHHNDPNFFEILNGGIANISLASSHQWVTWLFEMEFDDEFVEDIAGDKVKEHIDILSIHYAYEPDDLPPIPGRYAGNQTLERLYSKWMEPGVVKAIWNTEEGGAYGLGPYHLIYAVPRFLEFWSRKDWNSNSSRFIWWPAPGGKTSPKAEKLHVKVARFLDSSTRLKNIGEHLEIGNSEDFTGHAFATNGEIVNWKGFQRQKIVIFFYNRAIFNTTSRPDRASVASVRLQDVPGTCVTDKSSATAIIATTERTLSREASVETVDSSQFLNRRNQDIVISFEEASVPKRGAMVVFLTVTMK